MTDQWLVRKLLEQDKKIEALSRGGTGVGHTSIAPGEALTVISDDGEVVLGAGGVDYVDGPTPETPSAPTLKLGFGTIEVTWDGSFAAGEDENGIPLTAPVDLALVEIHASTDPDEEEWGGDTLKAQVKTKDGFAVTIGGFDVDDEVHVCLIAVSEVPKRSAPSATASLVIEGLDFSHLFNELDAATATITNAGEILVSETETLDQKLTEAFDAINAIEVGARKIHFEERPPTVDDPGTLGDTWFVGTVAGGVISNTTAQFYYGADGWTEMKLSHEVIGSVDVGTLVAGSAVIRQAVIDKLWAEVVVAKMVVAEEFIGENAILTGAVTAPKITASEELWAKIGEFVEIRAEQIQSNAIDGMVITGGTYRTSGGTGSWSDAGLFIAQPDGTSMVRFPTDGSPLSLTASDVQIDRASVTDLDLSFGSVRSGGQVTLAAGVTAPASPPELTTGWQKVCTLPKPEAVDPGDRLQPDWLGLGYWAAGSGHWVRAVNVLGAAGDTFDEIAVYSIDGVFEKAIQAGLNPRHGVTVIGDIAYVLGPDYQQSNIGKQWVHGFDLNTGARVTRWEFTRFWDVKNRLALGTDGTNLVVAGVAPAPTLFVLRFNPATGVQVGSDWSTATGSWRGGQDIEGVHVSGSEVTILPKQTARVYTASGGTLTRKTDSANASGFAGWDNPNRNGAGMVWRVGTYGAQVPFVVDGAGSVYEGFISPSDSTVQACFTWFNGTNETTPSPIAVITNPARNSTTFSVPTRDGMQKRVYVKINTGPWQVTTLPAAQSALTLLDAAVGAATSLPTANTFPAATPAVLKSSIGGFQVRGDGSGSWGPLTFHADGTMAGVAVTGMVTVNPTGANSRTGTEVTLPAGRFTEPPIVLVTDYSTVPDNTRSAVSVVSATSFTIYTFSTSTAQRNVMWAAFDGRN